MRTESRIVIAESVDDVWDYLCDVGRWPEWAPTVRTARIRDSRPFAPGVTIDQQAKGVMGMGYRRSQQVTLVEAPRYMAFAGPMGTSSARWGMELESDGDGQTAANMWVEVDLAGIMRVIPPSLLQSRVQGVSDREMVAIKRAVESGPAHGVGG